jgi:hypothetical protein
MRGLWRLTLQIGGTRIAKNRLGSGFQVLCGQELAGIWPIKMTVAAAAETPRWARALLATDEDLPLWETLRDDARRLRTLLRM